MFFCIFLQFHIQALDEVPLISVNCLSHVVKQSGLSLPFEHRVRARLPLFLEDGRLRWNDSKHSARNLNGISLILDQVTNGVAVRMAVLYLLAGAGKSENGVKKNLNGKNGLKEKKERTRK